ncbi:hypothetical protein ACFL1J_07140, partial [Pseudomonadota bacterium]
LGHKYKTTKASARPAMVERIKNPNSDPAVVFLSEVLVSGIFIPIKFRQFCLDTGFLQKPVLIEAILSANRLFRMVRFGKIGD